MTALTESRHHFPLQVTLHDTAIVFRPMTAACRDAMLEFARDLPEQDLLFLDRDIAQPAVVDQWVRDVSQGKLVTIAAWLEANHLTELARRWTWDTTMEPDHGKVSHVT